MISSASLYGPMVSDKSGFAGKYNQEDNRPIFRMPVGCDLPEDGGITGNIGKHDKPVPGAMEERPVMIDPKTGEKVYVDEYLKEHRPNVCYLA